MRLQFLGTGGSQPIPLPLCDCAICAEAREEGPPYERSGYSLFLHDLDGLIDAPEFVAWNLVRWEIPDLEYLFLSHWHPDHAQGLRVLGMRSPEKRDGETHVDAKRRTAPTVVTTRAVYERTCEQVPTLRHFVENLGYADLHCLDEDPFEIRGIAVDPLPYPLEDGGPMHATGFLFREGDRTLAVVTDDARYLDEGQLPANLDAAVFECGHFTHDPAGDRIAPDDIDDLSHEEVLERVRRVDPRRAVLSHVGHHYRRSYDDLRRRERDPEYDGVTFAYDGLEVEI